MRGDAAAISRTHQSRNGGTRERALAIRRANAGFIGACWFRRAQSDRALRTPSTYAAASSSGRSVNAREKIHSPARSVIGMPCDCEIAVYSRDPRRSANGIEKYRMSLAISARASCACSRLSPIDGVKTGPKGIETNRTSRIDRMRLSCRSLIQLPAMNWLFKEEPTHYNFDDLVKDKKAMWSGVKNPLAQKHL